MLFTPYGEFVDGDLAAIAGVRAAIEDGAIRAELQHFMQAGAAQNGGVRCGISRQKLASRPINQGAPGASTAPTPPDSAVWGSA